MKSLVPVNLTTYYGNGPPNEKLTFLGQKYEYSEQLRLGKIFTKSKNILGFSYWHKYTAFALGPESISEKKLKIDPPYRTLLKKIPAFYQKINKLELRIKQNNLANIFSGIIFFFLKKTEFSSIQTKTRDSRKKSTSKHNVFLTYFSLSFSIFLTRIVSSP